MWVSVLMVLEKMLSFFFIISWLRKLIISVLFVMLSEWC